MNADAGATTHYLALGRSTRYLPISEMEDGCLYLIHARNSHIGRWSAGERGFRILREKFGERFLFTEYHWDSNEHGTAKPFVKLCGPVAAKGLRRTLERKLRSLPYSEFMEHTKSFATPASREKHGPP